jgi:DNA-binding response OmpR family regulator
VLIVAESGPQLRDLALSLTRSGFSCSTTSSLPEALDQVEQQAPDLLLTVMDSSLPASEAQYLLQQARSQKRLPIICLVPRYLLSDFDPSLEIDDFVVEPWDAKEIAARAKRVLWRTNNKAGRELIACGDLVVDQGKCEAAVGGRLVSLTFREYELLRFLASNRGRVFTRDALLNEVWGYDYYGGDRTVDVHIRRLRGKIEDSDHIFIETVRNVGYRFRKDAPTARE